MQQRILRQEVRLDRTASEVNIGRLSLKRFCARIMWYEWSTPRTSRVSFGGGRGRGCFRHRHKHAPRLLPRPSRRYPCSKDRRREPRNRRLLFPVRSLGSGIPLPASRASLPELLFAGHHRTQTSSRSSSSFLPGCLPVCCVHEQSAGRSGGRVEG